MRERKQIPPFGCAQGRNDKISFESSGRHSNDHASNKTPRMAAGTRMIGWSGPSRRRVPRFPLQAAVDVSVLRSGIPDTLPGRSTNMGERGVSAVIAGELVPGETVGVEINLPTSTEPLRTRATVKYQHELRCGLEFVSMSAAQRLVIRDWAKEHKSESATKMEPPAPVLEKESVEMPQESTSSSGAGRPRR